MVSVAVPRIVRANTNPVAQKGPRATPRHIYNAANSSDFSQLSPPPPSASAVRDLFFHPWSQRSTYTIYSIHHARCIQCTLGSRSRRRRSTQTHAASFRIVRSLRSSETHLFYFVPSSSGRSFRNWVYVCPKDTFSCCTHICRAKGRWIEYAIDYVYI